MGSDVTKARLIRVQPKEAEINSMDAPRIGRRKRDEVKTIDQPTCVAILNSMNVLTALIGNLKSPCRRLSRAGLLLWVLNMAINFTYDCHESRVSYGYPWLAIRALCLVTCCAGTWLVVRRSLPWLDQGIKILKEDKIYRKALRDVDRTTKKLPFILVSLALTGGTLQYVIMRRDQAVNLGFGCPLHTVLEGLLHFLRFASGVHLYYALVLFWSVPTCIMLLVGFSMIEFREYTRAQLRIKGCPLPFRKAVENFNDRVNFVKDSSSACVMLLSMLLLFTLISLTVNAYIFLFVNRSAYLYIIHALVPLFLAVYPLMTASWVTKQYHWHLVTAVQAWAECPDSDSDTEQDVNGTAMISDQATPQAHRSFIGLHIPYIDYESVNEPKRSRKEASIRRLQNTFRGSARVVGRLQHRKKLGKFNFEKYILFLDKVSCNIGFSIAGVLVTWELVSAVFFFLTSLVALFVQESIFGKAKSTITI